MLADLSPIVVVSEGGCQAVGLGPVPGDSTGARLPMRTDYSRTTAPRTTWHSCNPLVCVSVGIVVAGDTLKLNSFALSDP
jgi:hypothetical protein